MNFWGSQESSSTASDSKPASTMDLLTLPATEAGAFYHKLNRDIDVLRKKVDKKLRDMMAASENDLNALNSALGDFKIDESIADHVITKYPTKSTRKPVDSISQSLLSQSRARYDRPIDTADSNITEPAANLSRNRKTRGKAKRAFTSEPQLIGIVKYEPIREEEEEEDSSSKSSQNDPQPSEFERKDDERQHVSSTHKVGETPQSRISSSAKHDRVQSARLQSQEDIFIDAKRAGAPPHISRALTHRDMEPKSYPETVQDETPELLSDHRSSIPMPMTPSGDDVSIIILHDEEEEEEEKIVEIISVEDYESTGDYIPHIVPMTAIDELLEYGETPGTSSNGGEVSQRTSAVVHVEHDRDVATEQNDSRNNHHVPTDQHPTVVPLQAKDRLQIPDQRSTENEPSTPVKFQRSNQLQTHGGLIDQEKSGKDTQIHSENDHSIEDTSLGESMQAQASVAASILEASVENQGTIVEPVIEDQKDALIRKMTSSSSSTDDELHQLLMTTEPTTSSIHVNEEVKKPDPSPKGARGSSTLRRFDTALEDQKQRAWKEPSGMPGSEDENVASDGKQEKVNNECPKTGSTSKSAEDKKSKKDKYCKVKTSIGRHSDSSHRSNRDISKVAPTPEAEVKLRRNYALREKKKQPAMDKKEANAEESRVIDADRRPSPERPRSRSQMPKSARSERNATSEKEPTRTERARVTPESITVKKSSETDRRHYSDLRLRSEKRCQLVATKFSKVSKIKKQEEQSESDNERDQASSGLNPGGDSDGSCRDSGESRTKEQGSQTEEVVVSLSPWIGNDGQESTMERSLTQTKEINSRLATDPQPDYIPNSQSLDKTEDPEKPNPIGKSPARQADDRNTGLRTFSSEASDPPANDNKRSARRLSREVNPRQKRRESAQREAPPVDELVFNTDGDSDSSEELDMDGVSHHLLRLGAGSKANLLRQRRHHRTARKRSWKGKQGAEGREPMING